MLFREIIAVYCENHMEHINTLFEQNVGIYNFQGGGIYMLATVLQRITGEQFLFKHPHAILANVRYLGKVCHLETH
jgi:predicted outer membrane repeat protein